MKNLSRIARSESIFFFKLAAICPLILLSSRVAYSLALSLILIIHISFVLFVRYVSGKFLEKAVRFSMELLMAATCIAVIDMLMTAYLPLIRADMGILLPFVFFQGQFFLSAMVSSKKSGEAAASNRMGKQEITRAYGELLSFIAMILILSLFRELLTYGKISLVFQPWDGLERHYFISIFSSVMGILFLFTAAYQWRKK